MLPLTGGAQARPHAPLMRRERAAGGLGVITVVDWLLPRRVARDTLIMPG